MACYLCGAPLARGQGVRRNVNSGSSVAGLFSTPPSLLLIVVSLLARGKMPSIRSYFALRTLCPSCAQRLDAQRSSRRKAMLFVTGFAVAVAIGLVVAAPR